MVCKKCGANVAEDATVCNFCGENLVDVVDPVGAQPVYQELVVEDKCTAVLVLGIVSIAMATLGCCGLSLVAFIPAIVGLVMANNAKKRGIENGNVKAGFILSLIALILSVLTIIGFIAYIAIYGFAVFASILSEAMYY